MEKPPTLFDLFGSEIDLTLWEQRVKRDDLPTREQLKAILLANPDLALPEWLLDIVILGIDGKLKGTRGRRRESSLTWTRWAAAKVMYAGMLPWLQQREKRCGLRGWNILRNQDWWQGSPHERAARMAIARYRLRIDVPAFLNRISSDKSPGLL